MKYILTFLSLCVLTICFTGQAEAQTIIRDTEIESYMGQWFAPIFEADGKSPEQVDIVLVQDSSINAFVAGGANIFFFTGLIEETDNAGELIGVMAHELGHISAGHLIRGRDAMEQASYESLLGMILGVGAALATGEGAAAGALTTGTSSMAQRRFLATARVYESSADQAALSTMEKAGINPSGLLTFMEKLESEEYLPVSQQSEYVRTHPLTRNRVEALKAGVERSPLKDKPLPKEWADQHARMKAKLIGFIRPQQVEWEYDVRDKSIPARYARAVAYYRENKVDQALNAIDGLIQSEPDNPYFHELKGQMLVDFGRLEQALPSYKKAISLKPDSGLMLTALAHAEIELAGDNPEKLKPAINRLQKAQRLEPRSARINRLLATAHGRMGDDAMARLYLAEEALLQRKYDYARRQAEIALKALPEKGRARLRAQDILNYVANRDEE